MKVKLNKKELSIISSALGSLSTIENVNALKEMEWIKDKHKIDYVKEENDTPYQLFLKMKNLYENKKSSH